MLEEIEEFVNEIVFGTGNVNDKLTRVLNSWKNRLQATQVKNDKYILFTGLECNMLRYYTSWCYHILCVLKAKGTIQLSPLYEQAPWLLSIAHAHKCISASSFVCEIRVEYGGGILCNMKRYVNRKMLQCNF